MLFVENIALTIFPIRKVLHVRRLGQYWLSIVIILLNLFLLWNDLEIFVCIRRSGAHVHPMWINDLGLFFKIEGLPIFEDNCLLKFVTVVFLVT